MSTAGFPQTPPDVAARATDRGAVDTSRPMVLGRVRRGGQDMLMIRHPDGRVEYVPDAAGVEVGSAVPQTPGESLLAGADLAPPVVAGVSSMGRGAPGFDYSSLIQNESGGNWQAQNDVPGSGGRGHFGRLQFSRGRLADAMRAGVIPEGTTPEQFMASPEMQQRVEAWHFSDIDRFISSQGLDRYEGQVISGLPVTRQGMHAVAHLGGNAGLRRFLESGGEYNPADAFGTRLSDYLGRHAGGPDVPSRAASAPAGPFPPRFEDVQNDPQASPTQPRFDVPEFQVFGPPGAPGSAQTPEAPQTFSERLMAGLEDLPEALRYLELADNSNRMRAPAGPGIHRPRRGDVGSQALKRLGLGSLA